MEDKQIVDLYWQRSELAIIETQRKYSKYCYAIAFGILHSREECEECINDAYMQTWQSIPPNRPNNLKTYLGKIIRNLSLNRYEYATAQKRRKSQFDLSLQELEECIPSKETAGQELELKTLTETINEFLKTLPQDKRILFVRRYWYCYGIKEISLQTGIKASKITYDLFQIRNKLKIFLEKEGYVI